MITTKKSFGSVRERIDHIGNRVKELIEVVHPTHIAIEDFTEQGKFVGTTYKEMAWLTEHFRMIGREVGIEVTLYENGVWKKKLMGASRVNKNQVQHFISHALPNSADHLKGRPDHVWDSVGVGLCKWKELNGL
jgi:Holliday junction resolvasome RuvABC endonuclease subunit